MLLRKMLHRIKKEIIAQSHRERVLNLSNSIGLNMDMLALKIMVVIVKRF